MLQDVKKLKVYKFAEKLINTLQAKPLILLITYNNANQGFKFEYLLKPISLNMTSLIIDRLLPIINPKKIEILIKGGGILYIPIIDICYV